MIPEAKQEQAVEVKPVSQYIKAKNETLTDLASFNAYAFVTLSDNQVVGVQLTGRHGITADDMYKDFQSFVTFLDLCAIDHGVKFVDKRNGMYQSEAQGPKPATPAENGSTPAASAPAKPARKWDEPVPQAELPAELAEVTVNVYTQEFDVIKVFPMPDEKATVEFWKDGLKFAVGAKINKAKYDTINQYLASLEMDAPIDPSKAGEYRIAGIQYWTQGNEYEYQGQKKHYKNIALLKPAL